MNERLGDYLYALAKECAVSRYCSVDTIKGEEVLRLCCKRHMSTIRLPELIRRVEEDMRSYGARAEEAQRNERLDFKALSYALRALEQMEELLRTGKIIFLLKNRKELIAIKEGKYSWRELELRILQRLEAVDAMRERSAFTGMRDAGFAEKCLLACYDQEPG